MPEHAGFLSPGLSTAVARIRRDFPDWFDAAEAFNDLAMRVLPAIKVDPSRNDQLVAATLFFRILTSFQSAILLSERGLMTDARTVIRSAAEAAIVLAALVKDPAVCDLLVDRHYVHHRKIRNAWLSDPLVATATAGPEIAAVKASLAEADSAHPRAVGMKKDPINLENLAKQAGVTDLYIAVYRDLSGDAAHASLDGLNRHVRVDSEGEIIGLKFGPDVAALPDTLSSAMSTIGHALHPLLELFSLPQFEAELERRVKAWSALVSQKASSAKGQKV